MRIAPAVLHEDLAVSVFRTGDATLDELLEAARHKILNRSIDVRRESLEKLWDAWERLKSPFHATSPQIGCAGWPPSRRSVFALPENALGISREPVSRCRGA